MRDTVTRADCKNVLVTAWNDSGAGRFMRLMDGADNLFAFPFELLLGAESVVGVKNLPSLVSGKYRWNVFRDPSQIQAVLEQDSIRQRVLDPSESELKDWLAARKFDALSQYRDQARAAIDCLADKTPERRLLMQPESVVAYIDWLRDVFAGGHAAINLIHCPCAALDGENQRFWNIFSNVIMVIIEPRWGFGNMNARNQIALHRYLERWLLINQLSLQLKQKRPEQVMIISSSVDTGQQVDNIARAHSFLGISSVNARTQTPTLLGEDIGEAGFPYGGILSWSAQSYQNSVNAADMSLSEADNHTAELFDQCAYLYELLEQ
jgi:hypothetical protein